MEPINTKFPEYRNICELLHMYAIPYIGKYADDGYSFLYPILTLHSKTCPKNIPKSISDRIKKLNIKDFNYYHITIDSSSIPNRSETRLNIVPHPYIFYDFKGKVDREHKTFVYCCLITDEDNFNLTIKEKRDEGDLLIINPDYDFNDHRLKREVIIHPSNEQNIPAISPNNIAFNVNLGCQMIHFYLITLGTYKNEVVKGCCCEIIILPSAMCGKIFLGMIRSFNDKKSIEDVIRNVLVSKRVYEDFFKNYFYICIDQIMSSKDVDSFKNEICFVFKKIFEFNDNDYNESHINDMELMAQFYYDYFKNFVLMLFDANKDNIEQNYNDIIMSSLNDEYIINIIDKFINFHTLIIGKIYKSYENYVQLNDDIKFIEDDVKEEYENNICNELKDFICSFIEIPKDTFDERVNDYKIKITMNRESKNLRLFKILKEKIEDDNPINRNDLEGIDPFFINALYFKTWRHKGSPENIHMDFGSISFLNENKIESRYFCSKEDRIKICDDMINIFEKINDSYKSNDDY